jgi:excisionase family DNA binding protein
VLVFIQEAKTMMTTKVIENLPEYLTVEQAAEAVDMSITSIRRYIQRENHHLPAYRVGWKLRIKKEDFLEWFEGLRL